MSFGPVPIQISGLFFPKGVFSDNFAPVAVLTTMFDSGCSDLSLFHVNVLE